MTDIAQLTGDLQAEQAQLDAVVAALVDDQWAQPTPSEGWTVADQISHLAYFDRAASQSIDDPDGFRVSAAELRAAGDVDALTLRRGVPPQVTLADWRDARARLAAACSRIDPTARLPWYGPAMGAKSFITARLMECWAHGEDVCAALNAPHPATDRLRHIVSLGINTRGWSYVNRGLVVPAEPVRLELDAPSGERWSFGPADAAAVVRGPAVDFCLVACQRRHVDDTALVTEGDAARDWLTKAQAFAGRATDGPPPRRTG